MATVIAHEDTAYRAAMITTAVKVAAGTVRRGSRLSSEKTTEDSKPTNPVVAMTSSAPTPGSNSAPGDRAEVAMVPPAGLTRSVASKSRMTATSAVSRTARMVPLTSTRITPSTAISAQATRAISHHAGRMPNHWSSSGEAAAPSAPYSPT